MGVVDDIVTSLRGDPRRVIRAHLARGPQEARSLAFLMAGCALAFVAQWPRLARESQLEGVEIERLVAYAMLGWLMAWPLAFYLAAGLAHWASRALGGRGTADGARLALFWAWLAASPLALATGLVAGLTGPSVATNVAGIAWLGAFAWLWARSQGEASLGPLGHVA